MDEIKTNITFSGDVDLLKWILKKYSTELPYNGSVYNFAKTIGYEKNTVTHWRRNGINYRIWNCLNKDLIISRLMGKIKDEKVMTLKQLKEEYKGSL